MALGFSGSNGGMAESYRPVVLADIDAGISKYEGLAATAEGSVRELYLSTASELTRVRGVIAAKSLDDSLED